MSDVHDRFISSSGSRSYVPARVDFREEGARAGIEDNRPSNAAYDSRASYPSIIEGANRERESGGWEERYEGRDGGGSGGVYISHGMYESRYPDYRSPPQNEVAFIRDRGGGGGESRDAYASSATYDSHSSDYRSFPPQDEGAFRHHERHGGGGGGNREVFAASSATYDIHYSQPLPPQNEGAFRHDRHGGGGGGSKDAYASSSAIYDSHSSGYRSFPTQNEVGFHHGSGSSGGEGGGLIHHQALDRGVDTTVAVIALTYLVIQTIDLALLRAMQHVIVGEVKVEVEETAVVALPPTAGEVEVAMLVRGERL